MILFQPGFSWGDASIEVPTDSRELIQELPYGYVNWSQGILVVKAFVGVDTQSNADSDSTSTIRELITQNIFKNLGGICFDARRSLLDVINSNNEIRGKLIRMARAAPILTHTNASNEVVEMVIRMQLYGGLSQLMLPSNIKQVEPIKAMNADNGMKAGNASTDRNRISLPEEASEDVYTGLIVDARNIDVQPSLVPVLVDENNDEVYGAAFVSREFAVQQGMCGYVRSMRDTDHRRVGRRPLLIKGLRRSLRGPCDIVISNSDAAKIRSASAHLAVLKQCRVVVLSD